MFKINGNAAVGQSGGPTSAINATLCGVIRGMDELRENRDIKLYGMVNGIEGFLAGKVIDIDAQVCNEADFELLKHTPASALGSCRFKLPSAEAKPEVYDKIFERFAEYDIRYFFYIGGNDSMDTVKKIAEHAEKINYPINVIGVPKTIDNDLEGTDHSPGFGSAAKYIASTMTEICADNAVYDTESVVITEIMGRDAGWLTMSAALPRFYGLGAPDLIYLPERVFDVGRFVSSVRERLKTKKCLVIAVSEGIRDADGEYICESAGSKEKDIFGHTWLSGTAAVLGKIIKRELGCKVRTIELNTPQRCAAHAASAADLDESVQTGRRAVCLAAEGMTGVMASIIRTKKTPYESEIGYMDIGMIANKIKTVPDAYINSTGDNVTDDGLAYIAPLVIGEPELVRLGGLPVHFIFKKG